MRFDHVIIATDDLARSADRLRATTGLVAVEGGTHDGLGTCNHIVPLGRGYLELVTAHNRDLAQGNDFGRLVLAALAEADEAIAGWAVEVDETVLRARAATGAETIGRLTRRGIGIHHLGMARARISPALPFLLARDAGSQSPEATSAAHAVVPTGIDMLTVAATRPDLDTWLATPVGDTSPPLPVTCDGTGRGITRIDIATGAGIVTLTPQEPTKGMRA